MRNKSAKGERQEANKRATDGTIVSGLSSPSPYPASLPLVIINPASASGATGRTWPQLASDLRTHFGAFNCLFTEQGGDARLIAKREARAGRKLIIACGGDGTISEVANGILESGAETELGILPSGTGGDFRRTLNIPVRGTDAAAALKQGRSRLVDVGRVEFQTGTGERATRYFLNVASCGMGGEVIRQLNENSALRFAPSPRWFGGRAAYAVAALQTTLTYEKPRLRLRLDDGTETRLTVASLCLANARYFGGGMKIAPEAKLNDGLLDVVAIGDLDRAQILTRVYRIYLGTHLGLKDVHHARARRIQVQADDPGRRVSLEMDGELSGTLPATFEVLPNRLRLRCPA